MTKKEIYQALNEICHETSCVDMDKIVDWIDEHRKQLNKEDNK